MGGIEPLVSLGGDEGGRDDSPGRGVDSDHILVQTAPRRCGETSVAYGLDMGMDSLFGSPSSSMIYRRSLCVRLVGRAGEDGGCRPFRLPLGGEKKGTAALIMARVGAYANELRLMGVGRIEMPTYVGGTGGDEGSLARKSPRACDPPAMDRM